MAAALGSELAAKGHDVPLTDLVVASLARRLGFSQRSSFRSDSASAAISASLEVTIPSTTNLVALAVWSPVLLHSACLF